MKLPVVTIVSTSASIEEFKEVRTREYLDAQNSIENVQNALKVHGIQTQNVVLECTSLDGVNWMEPENETKIEVFPNPSQFRNKGVGEMRALKWYLESVPKEKCMLVKHTGRYKFIDKLYGEILSSALKSEKEIIVRMSGEQVFFGAVAMMSHIWVDFLNWIDFVDMERRMINIEQLLAEYIARAEHSVQKVPEVGVLANIANDIERGLRNDLTKW